MKASCSPDKILSLPPTHRALKASARFRDTTGHWPWELIDQQNQPRSWTTNLLEMLSGFAQKRSFFVNDRDDFPAFQAVMREIIHERMREGGPRRCRKAPLQQGDIKDARDLWDERTKDVIPSRKPVKKSAQARSTTEARSESWDDPRREPSPTGTSSRPVVISSSPPPSPTTSSTHKAQSPAKGVRSPDMSSRKRPCLDSPAETAQPQSAPVQFSLEADVEVDSSSLAFGLTELADDCLYRLDEVNSALAEAQTDLEVAQSGLRLARTATDRLDADVQRAQAEFEIAKAAAQKAQQTYRQLQSWLDPEIESELATLEARSEKAAKASREMDSAAMKLDLARYERDTDHREDVSSLEKKEKAAAASVEEHRKARDALNQKIEATKTFRRVIILGPSRFQDFLKLSGLSWNIQTSMERYMADNDIRDEDPRK